MKTRVLKWGNSLAVRIPKLIAKDARLKEGDAVELITAEEGLLQVRRSFGVPSLSELVARITPANRHGEVSIGKSVGRESDEW